MVELRGNRPNVSRPRDKVSEVTVTKGSAPTIHPGGRRWGGPSALREVLAFRELLVNLTLREMRSKYRRTALGQGWSLLNPIAFLTIYSLVFSFVLQVKPPQGSPSGLDTYVLWLASGLLPFLFFSTVVNSGLGALVSNANLIKKVYFPRETLVLSTAVATLFTFLIELSILHAAILGFGGSLNPLRVLATLFLTGLLFLFAVGVALIASVVNVYFRDTQHLLGIVLQAWLYATPVIYPITLVETRLGEDSRGFLIYSLNPLAQFVEAFRHTLYDGRMPDGSTVGYLVLVTAAVLLVGHVVFRLLEGTLAEEL